MKVCADCGEQCPKLTRCAGCGEKVCSWCFHTKHNPRIAALQLQGITARTMYRGNRGGRIKREGEGNGKTTGA